MTDAPRAPLTRQYQAMLAWAADDHTLLARTGQQGTLLRNSVGVGYTSQWWYQAMHSQPRFVTTPLGLALLLEPDRTNAWTYSRDQTNAAWTKTRVTAATAPGPDGALASATVLREDSSTNTHLLTRATGSFTANTTQAVLLVVRAAGRTKGRLRLVNGAVACGVDFDLAAGTAVAHTASTGTVSSVDLTALGTSGFYAIRLAGKVGASATSATLELYLKNDAGSTSYAGDTSKGLVVGQLQLEVNQLFPTSPILTTSSTATRDGERLTFPYLAAPRALTAYLDGYEIGACLGASATYLQLSDATDPRLVLGTTATPGQFQATHDDGTTVVTSSTATSGLGMGDRVEALVTLLDTGQVQVAVARNGGTPVLGAVGATTNTVQAAWGASQLVVGGAPGADALGLALRRLLVVPGAVTLELMRARAR